MIFPLFTTLLFAGAALCAPTPRRSDPLTFGVLAPLYRRSADSNSTRYIVSLHQDTVDPSNRLNWLNNILGANSGGAQKVSSQSVDDNGGVVHHWDPSVFNGLSGTFNAQELDTIRAQSEVAWVEEDFVIHKTVSPTLKQTDATWGLARISSNTSLTVPNNFDVSEGIFTYSFPATAGAGVDVYIVDTGVRTSHADFGGRAEFLGSFGQGVAGQDKDGHGTHVAGTATGQTFGIAKNASVFAVKVLGDDGSGLTTDIISGLNLVASRVSNVSQADGGNYNASSSVVLNLPNSAVVEIPGTTITASFATATQVLTFPPIITTVTFPAISTSVSPSSTPVSLSSIDNIQSQSSTSAASSQSSISVTPVFNTVSTVAVRRAVPTASPSALPSQGNGQNTIGANAIRPSVVNMSLGGSANSRSFDAAVKSLVAQGIVVVVAAGNEGVDVGNSSPAGIAEAITVGAADVNDGVASFSNFGSKVDVFGPGVGILSCGVKNNLDTAILSGTSQATPHIAGLAAVLLGEDPTLTPAQVKAKIQTLAIRGALSNIPAGTQNRVAFNGL